MTKYLKLFDKHSSYNNFLQSADFLTPNVSHCIMEQDVHYNPISFEISGKFTVPSRLLTMAKETWSNNGGYTNCYNADCGVADASPTYEYSDNTEILNADKYQVYDTITDATDGKEYKIISFNIPNLGINDSTNEITESTVYNEEDGQYYYQINYWSVNGRLDSNGYFESGWYNGGTWNADTFPKVEIRQLRIYNSDTNTYSNENINCIYLDSNYNPSQSHLYNGKLNVIEPSEYPVLLLPVEEYDQSLINGIDAVFIDDIKIDLETLIENNGWYTLETGVHDVKYYLNRNAVSRGFVKVNVLKCVPIEEMVLDTRIKGTWAKQEPVIEQEWSYEEGDYVDVIKGYIYTTAFDNCALLGTSEDVIEKVCTMKDTDTKRIIETSYIDCEFVDNDDYINKYEYGLFSDTNYFALNNGVAGLHDCKKSEPNS